MKLRLSLLAIAYCLFIPLFLNAQSDDLVQDGENYYSKKLVLLEDFEVVGPGWSVKSGILLQDRKLNLNQRNQNFLFENLDFAQTDNIQIRIRLKYNSYEPTESKKIIHEIDWIGKDNSMRLSHQGILVSAYSIQAKHDGIPSGKEISFPKETIKNFKDFDIILRKLDGKFTYIINGQEVPIDGENKLVFNKVETVIIHFSGSDALLNEIEIAELEKAEKPKPKPVKQKKPVVVEEVNLEDVVEMRSSVQASSASVNAAIAAGSEPGQLTFHALIIGNNNYNDAHLADLDQPIIDATNLYNELINHYIFDNENVIFLKDATRRDIISAMDMLSNKMTENDNLLIFYAGHGHWDSKKEMGYWLPVDAEQDITVDWLRNSTVQGYIENIETKHTLLIADACFGGGIFKTRAAFKDASKSINNLYRYKSRKAMTSGMLNEVPDKSIFMENLVERLVNNEEKYLPSMDLFMQFREYVMNNSYNAPQYGTIHNTGDKGGDFIFITREQ